MPLPWYTWSRIARKQWWDVLNGTTWMPSRTRRINCRDWFDEVRESSLVLRISRVVCSNGSVKVASRRHYAARHSRLKLIHRVCHGSSPFFSFFSFFPFFFYLKKETIARAFHRYSTTTTTRHLLKRACAH